MKIFEIRLRESAFNRVSQEEKGAVLALAHLANEINTLFRLLYWARNYQADNAAGANGQVVLVLFLLRMLAGKLYEGNNLLRKKFYGNGVSREYAPALSDRSRRVLKKIQRYFRRSNNIVKYIRNHFAFHYTPEEIAKTFSSIPPEEMVLYTGDKGTINTLFFFAEAAANRAILEYTGLDGFRSYQKVIGEVIEVATWFSFIIQAIVEVFFSRLGHTVWDGLAKEVESDQLPVLDDISLPWFVNADTLF